MGKAERAVTLFAKEVDMYILIVVFVVAQTEFVTHHASTALDDVHEVVGAKHGQGARDDRLVY